MFSKLTSEGKADEILPNRRNSLTQDDNDEHSSVDRQEEDPA